MAILISLRAAATEAGSAEWADWSESAKVAELGGVPEMKKLNDLKKNQNILHNS